MSSRPAGALVHIVTAYQRWLSPALVRRCRYEPTCSEYARQAVVRYGAGRGLVLATARVLRCHPWAAGGVDPVPAVKEAP